MKEDCPKALGNSQRRNRWLQRQVNRAVSLSPEQIRLIKERWGEPNPDDSDEEPRRIRTDKRGTFPEAVSRFLAFVLALLVIVCLFFWWVHHAI